MMLQVRVESKEDYRVVEELTREAFFNVYLPGCKEHYVLHKFRDSNNFIKELSLVLELDGNIIGHVMFAKAKVKLEDGSYRDVHTFGPFSIHPKYQKQGYGKYLLNVALNKAEGQGVKVLLACGSIDYYKKFGFSLASSRNVRYAFAETNDKIVPYFLIKEFDKNYLNASPCTYQEPDEYFVADKEPDTFERYEQTFPYKEKKNTDTQIF